MSDIFTLFAPGFGLALMTYAGELKISDTGSVFDGLCLHCHPVECPPADGVVREKGMKIKPSA